MTVGHILTDWNVTHIWWSFNNSLFTGASGLKYCHIFLQKLYLESVKTYSGWNFVMALDISSIVQQSVIAQNKPVLFQGQTIKHTSKSEFFLHSLNVGIVLVTTLWLHGIYIYAL